MDWAEGKPQWGAAVEARAELLRHFEEQLTTWERDFLLSNLSAGPKAFSFATTLVRLANELRKPDLERDEAYMERDSPG